MGDKGTVDRAAAGYSVEQEGRHIEFCAAVDDALARAQIHIEFRNASRALQSGCTPDPDREAAQARCDTVNHRKNVLGS